MASSVNTILLGKGFCNHGRKKKRGGGVGRAKERMIKRWGLKCHQNLMDLLLSIYNESVNIISDLSGYPADKIH